MGKQCGPFYLEKTIDDICFYRVGDEFRVRQLNPLDGERVKTSPRFRRTMEYARWMGASSKIGSGIYKALPEWWRQFWMYREFVGEAMAMMKEGKTVEEAEKVLWTRYVAEFEEGHREENDFQYIAESRVAARPHRTGRRTDNPTRHRRAGEVGRNFLGKCAFNMELPWSYHEVTFLLPYAKAAGQVCQT